jgi:hypothetical protein
LCITGPALFGRLFILGNYDLKLVDIEHTQDGKLAYKNKAFATMYRQYRDEQRGEQHKNGQNVNGQNTNRLHYSDMWKNMEVYSLTIL